MNKKYWLRVALSLVVVHLILLIITFIISSSSTGPEAGFVWIWISLLDLPVLTLAKSFISGSFGLKETAILVFVAGSIQWFLIGGFLGWLYGKIKNRNKVI